MSCSWYRIRSLVLACQLLYPIGMGVDQSIKSEQVKIATCVNRCGQTSLPCSCDARCRVYRNCCEDLSQACPQVVQEVEEKFQHLLHSEVLCSSADVLMVASCPNKRAASQSLDPARRTQLITDSKDETTTRELSSESVTNTPSTATNVSNPMFLFELRDVPVTDLHNGIVYTNMDTFNCNKNEYSSPVSWSVQVKILSSSTAKSLLEIWESLDLSVYHLHEPSYIDAKLRALPCYSQSVSSCNDVREDSDKTLEHKCKSYINYIERGNSTNKTIYQNADCCICNGLSNTSCNVEFSTLKEKKTLFRFSLMFDTNEHSIHVAMVEIDYARNFPWKESICNISGPFWDMQNTSCQVECSSLFQKRNGVCKRRQVIWLAFPVDNNCSLTREDVDSLSTTSTCLLSHSGYDTDDRETHLPRPVLRWSTFGEELVYVFKVFVYSKRIVHLHDNGMSLLLQLDLIAKALQSKCKPMTISPRDSRYSDTLPLKTAIFEHTLPLYQEESVGVDFTRSNATSTTCGYVGKALKEDDRDDTPKSATLKCWSIRLSEQDRERVQAMRKSPCFVQGCAEPACHRMACWSLLAAATCWILSTLIA